MNAVSLELNTPVHNTENAEWNENQWFFLTTHPRTESPSKQHPQTRERQEIQSHGQDLAAGREAAITIKEQEHLNGNFL